MLTWWLRLKLQNIDKALSLTGLFFGRFFVLRYSGTRGLFKSDLLKDIKS
jgi:hypothetical protein